MLAHHPRPRCYPIEENRFLSLNALSSHSVCLPREEQTVGGRRLAKGRCSSGNSVCADSSRNWKMLFTCPYLSGCCCILGSGEKKKKKKNGRELTVQERERDVFQLNDWFVRRRKLENVLLLPSRISYHIFRLIGCRSRTLVLLSSRFFQTQRCPCFTKIRPLPVRTFAQVTST